MAEPAQGRTPDRTDPSRDRDPAAAEPAGQETQNAEEWGSRHDTGKSIARGGKSDGDVEGATEQQP